MRRYRIVATLAFLTLLNHACLASFDDSTSENSQETPLRNARVQIENMRINSPPALIAKPPILNREKNLKRSLQSAFSVSDENAAPSSSLENTAIANIPEKVQADELQDMLDRLRVVRGQDPLGHVSDEILPNELQDIIKGRLQLEGQLPADYKDIRLLKKDGIRYVILDTEWDEKRNLTEISAIEFINGKRGKIVFSKYGKANPACNNLKSFLEFIQDDPASGLFTIAIAHNAPADKGILFHELSKHFAAAANLHNAVRILEHEVFTTYWFDTYHYLRRQWMIQQDKANEQVKITPVEFSYATAAQKKLKARQDKEKRALAKKRKEQREKEKECQLIADGNLMTDGSLVGRDTPKPAAAEKPSFKLGDAFKRTNMPMDTVVRRLNMHNGVTKEKGIQGNQFTAHNALFDITMTYALVLAEQQQLMEEYPAKAVKTLKRLF